MVCPLVRIDARLEYKLKSLAKHNAIVERLRSEIKIIESEKSFMYFQMMNGKGVY